MESLAERIKMAKRSPRRISITVNWLTYERIQYVAFAEGRSASNLSAYVLEKGMKEIVEAMRL